MELEDALGSIPLTTPQERAGLRRPVRAGRARVSHQVVTSAAGGTASWPPSPSSHLDVLPPSHTFGVLGSDGHESAALSAPLLRNPVRNEGQRVASAVSMVAGAYACDLATLKVGLTQQ